MQKTQMQTSVASVTEKSAASIPRRWRTPFPLSSPCSVPAPSSPFLPLRPLEVGPLNRSRGLESAKLPQWGLVWGKVPADKGFSAYLSLKEQGSSLHDFATRDAVPRACRKICDPPKLETRAQQLLRWATVWPQLTCSEFYITKTGEILSRNF